MHKRMRVNMDSPVIVQLLQEHGITFNSCSPCLAKLLLCHHMRPTQKDPRVVEDGPESDDEDGPDVLLLHPDANDKLFDRVTDAEDGSSLFRMLKESMDEVSKKQKKLLDGEEYTNKMREHEEATRPHIETIHRQGFHQILR